MRSARTADTALLPVATRQQQIVTRAQLLAIGVDDMAICRRTKRGHYQRVLPAVYSLVTGTLTREQRRIAAALYAGPDAQITGPAALIWYGFRYAPSDERIHVLVPHGTRRRSADYVVVQRTLELDEHARNGDGYAVCSPARAVVDACRILRDLRTVRAVVAEAVQRNFADLASLDRAVRRASRSRTALVRLALAEVVDGVRSSAEADLRSCLAPSRILPEILWNPALSLPDGAPLPTPDGWLPDAAIALEVDSQEFHFSPDDWRRTLDRHNLLSRHGILVLHFTPKEVRSNPSRVLATVEDAYRSRQGVSKGTFLYIKR